jgi:type VI secretion system FHA domain protein
MAFTLVIRSQSGQGGKEISPQRFEQLVVTIGRGDSSDLVLKDPQRRVSSRHAEIRAKASSWVLVDVGSTNGTKLNDVRLTPRHEYVLHDGDRITLGDFLLTFGAEVFPRDLPNQVALAQPAVSAASPLCATHEIDGLLYLLRRAYANPEAPVGGNRRDHLEALLRQAVAHLDRQAGLSFLGSLRSRLSTKTPPVESAKPSRAAEPARPTSPSRRSGGGEPATEDFLDLAGRFCEKLDQPLSRDLLDQVVRRIDCVLHVVFAGLADAIKGRREFQREFEVEATRILDWSLNPIKHAESPAEIAALLLDPRSQRLTEDQVKTFLREVFQDLTLHQLGLMAGFRECVRGLLKEFDPVALTKGGKGESTGKTLGLLGGKSVRTDAEAWRRFLEKYRQLTEEEVRVFEQILAPHFAKGYLSIQKTRRRK